MNTHIFVYLLVTLAGDASWQVRQRLSRTGQSVGKCRPTPPFAAISIALMRKLHTWGRPFPKSRAAGAEPLRASAR